MATGIAHLARTKWKLNQGGATVATTDGFGVDDSYSIRVRRDGAVALTYTERDLAPVQFPRVHADRLVWMWEAAVRLLDRLGGMGEAHAVIRIPTREGVVDAATWLEITSSGRSEMEAMLRDVERALGSSAGIEPERATE